MTLDIISFIITTIKEDYTLNTRFLDEIIIDLTSKLLKYKIKNLEENKVFLDILKSSLNCKQIEVSLINRFIVNLTTNLNENIEKPQDIPEEIKISNQYKLQFTAYDIVLNLIMKTFTWDLFFENTPEATLSVHNLYLFWMIHKYSNRLNKIKLNNSLELSKDFWANLVKLVDDISNSLKNHTFNEDIMTRFFVFLKCLGCFALTSNAIIQTREIFLKLNNELTQLILNYSSVTKEDTAIEINTSPLVQEFEYNYFSSSKTYKYYDIMILLKSELTSCIINMGFESWNNEKIIIFMNEELSNINEMMIKNLYWAQSLANMLEVTLKYFSKSKLKDFDSVYLTKINETYYINRQTYSKLFHQLGNNLSSPIEDIRKANLNILITFTPETMNNASDLCDMFSICAKVIISINFFA